MGSDTLVEVFGIRHHGIGSCRAMLQWLDAFRPQMILFELPVEIRPLLRWFQHPKTKPPLAALFWKQGEIDTQVTYPFAEFSPEWQLLRYAHGKKLPVRCIDLPLAYRLGNESETVSTASHFPTAFWDQQLEEHFRLYPHQPYHMELAELRHSTNVRDETTLLREAYMRQQVRLATKCSRRKRVGVVCGLWHAAVLQNFEDYSDASDARLLQSLPEVAVESCLIPWRLDWLSTKYGYSSGIQFPGWAGFRFRHSQEPNIGLCWLTDIAQELRQQGQGVSTAAVMQAKQLATQLATLRGNSQVELNDLRDAALSCYWPVCEESFLEDKISGNSMGQLPASVAAPPLQREIQKQLRHLTLDSTRKWSLNRETPLDLKRSRFLHRCQLLQLKLVTKKDNFRNEPMHFEHWVVAKEVDHQELLNRSGYGNTMAAAAERFVIESLRTKPKPGLLSSLLYHATFAALNPLWEKLLLALLRIRNADQLRQELPMLLRLTTLPSLRKSPAFQSLLQHCMNCCLTHIRNHEPAEVLRLHEAFMLLRKRLKQQWNRVLKQWAGQEVSASSGLASRLLWELEADAVLLMNRFDQVFQPGVPLEKAMNWWNGLLSRSAAPLLLQPAFLVRFHTWLSQIDERQFLTALPIFRESFAWLPRSHRQNLIHLLETLPQLPVPEENAILHPKKE